MRWGLEGGVGYVDVKRMRDWSMMIGYVEELESWRVGGKGDQHYNVMSKGIGKGITRKRVLVDLRSQQNIDLYCVLRLPLFSSSP